MTRIALIAIVVAYLPGAVLFRLPVARRARRAALPAEERLFWAVVLSVLVSSMVGLGLAAAGLYTIGRLLLIDGAIAVGLAAAARGDLRLGPAAARTGWTAAAPAAIAALASGMFFFVPPSEYVIGGRDPGVYLNSGIQIAQRGSLIITDPVVRDVPAEHRPLFFPSPTPRSYVHRPGYERLRAMGFFVVDEETGAVVGQFPNLYPLWVAIAYDAAGLTGARAVIGLQAVLAVLAVYFAGAWLIGRRAALAGAALLAIHVAQVWYARYPNAEILLQLLVFAGLLAWARAQVDDDRFFAPAAGGLIGLSVFAHFTGILAIGAAAVAAVLGRTAGQRLPASFIWPLAAAGGIGTVYYLTILTPYVSRPISYAASLTPLHLTLLAAGGLTTAAAAVAAGRPGLAPRVRVWLPPALLAAVWIGAGYALFVREAGGRLAPHDADGLRTYAAFYLGPVGLAAALAGWTVISGDRAWRGAAFLAVTATFAFVIFYKARVIPEHFWMARRFVPVILPASLLLAGAAAFTPIGPAWRRGMAWMGASIRYVDGGAFVAPPPRLGTGWLGTPAGRRIRTAAGVVLIAGLGWQYAGATRPILRHVEYAGLIPHLEGIAAGLTPADLLLFESRYASDLHVLATPLQYIYARSALVLYDDTPDKAAFRRFLDWAHTRYDRVLFLGGGGTGGTDLLSRGTPVTHLGGNRFTVPEYEHAANAYPTAAHPKVFTYGLYAFLPGRVPAGVFTLDVGAGDDLYVRRIHGAERDVRGDTFRWTRDRSHVAVLGTRADARTVTLHLSDGGRPAAAGPARVQVSIADQPLGTITVTGDRFRPYRLALPPDLARRIAAADTGASLQIETDPWIPRDLRGGSDGRALGVMLSQVEIR